jgi:hypothetical protein
MGVYNPGDDTMPGDPTGPDQGTVDQMNSAITAGYSYNDIAAYHADQGLDAPPRPPLDAVMSGQDLSQASNWSAPAPSGDNDPTKLMTADAARPLIDQLAEAGTGVGAIEEVGAAVGSTVRSMVQATTEEARVPLLNNTDIQQLQTVGAKGARYIAGAAAGSVTYQYGAGIGKENKEK